METTIVLAALKLVGYGLSTIGPGVGIGIACYGCCVATARQPELQGLSLIHIFVFGACMGAMLSCVLLWFSNASRALSSDKVMALFGNAAPTIGLMLSMAMRLVPQFMRRGAAVGDVQRACTSAGAAGPREGARSRLRLTSVLMGWDMEDSLDTLSLIHISVRSSRAPVQAVRKSPRNYYRF